jgi:hypothetical protein
MSERECMDACVGEGQLVSECLLVSPLVGVTSSSQTPPLIAKEGQLLNTYLGKNKNLIPVSQWDSEPRITVLARASSNLASRPTDSQLEVRGQSWWLPV